MGGWPGLVSPGGDARIRGMTTKERLHELIDRLPDSPETERRLAAAEHDLEPSGAGNGAVVKAKKAGRLSFSAIGAGDPPDASERVDEFVARAIDRAHPAS
jgi:hypothetical protein